MIYINKSFVPLLTVYLQCFDQLNVESTFTPKYFTGLLAKLVYIIGVGSGGAMAPPILAIFM